MKLVSFQSMDALKDLINKGYLEVDEQHINIKKYGHRNSHQCNGLSWFVWHCIVLLLHQIVRDTRFLYSHSSIPRSDGSFPEPCSLHGIFCGCD